MESQQTIANATVATASYIWLRLPIGRFLTRAAARNSGRGGGRITLLMSPASGIDQSAVLVAQAGPLDYMPLNGNTWQQGSGDWVEWQGKILVEPGSEILVAAFAAPLDVGNRLYLIGGVEFTY